MKDRLTPETAEALLAESPEQAAQLNDCLWTVSDTDFLPHVMADDPLAAAVVRVVPI